jgi:hypothetical protein
MLIGLTVTTMPLQADKPMVSVCNRTDYFGATSIENFEQKIPQ